MYIICYHDNDITRIKGNAYDTLPVKSEIADPFTLQEAISDWKKANPNCTVDYVFSSRDSLTERPLYSTNSFREHAERYGLDPELEGKPVSIFGAPNCIFCAIYPRKRKYPIVVYDTDNEKYIRITPAYARSLTKNGPHGPA